MSSLSTTIIPARDPKQGGGGTKILHYKCDDNGEVHDDGDDDDDDDDDDWEWGW